VRALILALLAGCSSGVSIDQIDNAGIVVSPHTGSAVYVGGGILVTNWHVCLVPLFDGSLGDDDFVRFYVDDGAPDAEGAEPDDFYCPAPAGGGGWVRSQVGGDGCMPLSNATGQSYRFTRVGAEASPARIVFADWSLDLCLVEIAPVPGLPAIEIEEQPVAIEQEVVVAGHQTDAGNDVGVEICRVTETVVDVLDPDPIQPSPLMVPSFKVDCREVEHGSSGSPVFDAATGKLLGLVWTGTNLGTEEAEVYVTAASEWLGKLEARPDEQYAPLRRLFQK
jgi:hypothetical protein